MTQEELTSAFIRMQKDLVPDVSIEVGAHAAEFSNTMAMAGIRAYAFEASPYVYENFKDSVHPGVKYINKAVSYQDDMVMFQIDKRFDPKNTGHNTIMKRAEDLDYEYVKVEAVSLDDFSGIDANIVLWIDCEGANREVLSGASKLLNKVSSIHIEVETKEFWKNQWLLKDVENYLAGYGFKEFARADVDIYGHQVNIIYVKE